MCESRSPIGWLDKNEIVSIIVLVIEGTASADPLLSVLSVRVWNSSPVGWCDSMTLCLRVLVMEGT